MHLSEKTAFITGGTRGIGRATCAALLGAGAKVFVMARSQGGIDELMRISPSGHLAAFCGDVGNEADVEAAFDECAGQFGSADILINNAGIGTPTPDLSDTDAATFDEMVRTNMRGVFLCSREALRQMKPRGSGHIVSIVSMAGQRTNAGAPLYCASKFGARGLSGGIADQVLSAGIRVTDVNPGPVDTDYWGDRDVPREKFLSPEDVARVILFVVSTPEHVVIREINLDSLAWLGK